MVTSFLSRSRISIGTSRRLTQENRARRTASNSSATKEAKPLGVLTPGGVYVENRPRERKKCKSSCRLPVARKTLGSCGVSLRTGNWQLATAYDVGSGHQSGGHVGSGASGNDHVVIVTRTKTTEHWSCLLRLDQSQVSQEREDVFGGLQSRGNETDFDIFVVEVPSQ